MRQRFTNCLSFFRLYKTRFLLLSIVILISCNRPEYPPFLFRVPQNPHILFPFATPSSICTDGKYMYVANIGQRLLPVSLDEDGFISKITKNGKIEEPKFIKGLHAPADLLVIDTLLLATDVDRVKGFSLSSGEQVLDISFLGGTIDDMAYDGEEFLYVTANLTNRIYRTSLKTYTTQLLTENIPSPSGIAFDPQTNSLFVSQFIRDGSGKIINFSLNDNTIDKKVSISYQGFLDGLHISEDGNLFFTDWNELAKNGVVGWIRRANLASVAISLPRPVDNPSDVLYDSEHNAFWITDLTRNRVYCFFIKRPKS